METTTTMKAAYENVEVLVLEREELIAKINANPKTATKKNYRIVRGTATDELWGMFNDGKLGDAMIAAAVKDGQFKKEPIKTEKTGDPLVDRLKEVDKGIKAGCAEIQQIALSQKTAKRISTGTGNGNHVITQAWFDAHKNQCPDAMDARFENGRLTYNLPKKSGRGSTTSHGALNNIINAFGGKVSKPAPKVEPKKVPKKAGKK